jgi:hypothetical protein
MPAATVTINRAPVLTLWAAVVAHRLGFDWDESLTLGRAVAGLNAYSKGRSLGLFRPSEARRRTRPAAPAGEAMVIDLLHRAVPAVRTPEGIRALEKGKPADPDSVRRYLESRFKGAFEDAKDAMTALARSIPRERLADEAFTLYEQFRPAVPAGAKGWGAAGTLDLGRIRALAAES